MQQGGRALHNAIQRGQGLIKQIREAARPALKQIEGAMANLRAHVRARALRIWARIQVVRAKLRDAAAQIRFRELEAYRSLIHQARQLVQGPTQQPVR